MEKYVSHYSAAKIWNIPFIDTVLGSGSEESNAADITVSEHCMRFRQNGKLVHSCGLALPDGAVVSRDGIMVASPELLFLELAGKLSIHRLILLGLQLCSHKQGMPSGAITTKQRLNAFLAKTPGHIGHGKALRAVKYLENGSASIMESLTYMILTLPHNLGGYGLDGAVFNYPIELNDEMRTILGQNRCYIDIYYKQEKIAVEYDSFAFHKRPLEQGRDLMRQVVLERMGINVMRLSTIQLYDKETLRLFAHNLAARLSKRIRIRTDKFNKYHSDLRDLLPDKKAANYQQNDLND